jgi:CubicO group peptidase (beta-lactamase class C family)
MARLLLILLLAAAAPAQELAARVDEFIAGLPKERPFNGSILLSKNNEILLARGYGMANLEHNVPNTPRTKFRLGSITKQFAAAGILQLEERGKLKVEDPICKYVPDCPEIWKAITIHHLLTHTSGIFNLTASPDYRKEMMIPSPPLQTIKKVRDRPLDFEPGSKFSYSNSGYIVLAIIVEKASGESWDAFLRKNIFDPAGMNDSGHDTFAAILPHRASGYQLAGDKWIHSPYHDMEMPTGGGDLYSTVEDMYRWDLALQGEKILSAASKAKMYTPFLNNYAYGWAVDRQFGRRRLTHGGGINGFVTAFSRFPDERAVVVVLSNFMGSPMQQVTRAVTAMLFGEKHETPGQ